MPIVDIPGLFLPSSSSPIMLCFSHIKLHPCASFPPSLLAASLGVKVSSPSPYHLSFPYAYLLFGYHVNGLPYTPAELVTRSFTATPSSLLAFLAVATVIYVIACPSMTLLKRPFRSHGTQASYVQKASNEGLT